MGELMVLDPFSFWLGFVVGACGTAFGWMVGVSANRELRRARKGVEQPGVAD